MIQSVRARQVFDSRGNPTLEVAVAIDNSVVGVASVPSGASTGRYEAFELRDGNPNEYFGRGVTKAIHNVNHVIGPALANRYNVSQQEEIDRFMIGLDGSQNKERLGANAILGVSLAVARCAAQQQSLPLWKWISQVARVKEPLLPMPAFNVLNGGKHAGNMVAIQEFMLVPVGASSFHEAMRMGTECYHHLRALLVDRYGPTSVNVGDEGGFAPNVASAEECLLLLTDAIERAGYTDRVKIAMDCAASEFYVNRRYDLNFKQQHRSEGLSGKELGEYYHNLVARFPIVSIEDPFDQDDVAGWSEFLRTSHNQLQVVGDDLTVSNMQRIRLANENGCCNCLLLKVNQIGTLTEAIEAVQLARSFGWQIMTSHRSGETEDTFIADLAVALGTGQIKSGAPCRSERVAKYNRLLAVEQESNGTLRFAHPFNRQQTKQPK